MSWQKVGRVGVDSGTLLVGDPCYFLQGKHSETFGKTWIGFCEKISPKVHEEGAVQLGKHLAVLTTTGVGDGLYDVYVRRDADGRVEAVKVVFLPRRKKRG